MSQGVAILAFVGLVLGGALASIWVLLRRNRDKDREIARYQQRDWLRLRYCDTFGTRFTGDVRAVLELTAPLETHHA